MVNIKTQLVPDVNKNTFPGENPCTHLTVHMTGNKNAGANAQAHANLQSRGNPGRAASWHLTVDDIQAILSYPLSKRCFHAGDGKGHGNMSSIAMEICVNSDGDIMKAVQNGAEAAAQIMKQKGIPLSRVVQHYAWSKKNCPTQLRSGNPVSWDEFLQMIAVALGGGSVSNGGYVSPSTPAGKLDPDGWWGKGTTTKLQQALGTPVDGIISSQNVAFDSVNPGLTTGWEWLDPQLANKRGGSACIRALQAWAGVPVKDRDGFIGPQTIGYVQRKLKKMGYYKGRVDNKLSSPSLTIKGLQRALNDGAIRL